MGSKLQRQVLLENYNNLGDEKSKKRYQLFILTQLFINKWVGTVGQTHAHSVESREGPMVRY